MSTRSELRDSWNQGQTYAEINSTKDAIVRAFQVGAPASVALLLPIAWYWKIACFLGMMQLVAIVVTTSRARRERLIKIDQIGRELWNEKMEAWLLENPNATKDEQLTEAGRLLDIFGLRASQRS